MSGYQSLKSANVSRVSTGRATHLYASGRNLGESLFCPASAGEVRHDIYNRPASQNTLPVMDSACSNYTEYPTRRFLQVESMHRPYTPICSSGLRGAADFMGKGRDLLPQNLYGEGERGNFVRHSYYPNNALPDASKAFHGPFYYHRKEQPYTYSMDGTLQNRYKG